MREKIKEEMEDVLVCTCGNSEHQIIFRTVSNPYEPDPQSDNEVYANIHLTEKPFWQRVRYGIKYIFGYKSRYGAFDEIILGAQHASRLRKVADRLDNKD